MSFALEPISQQSVIVRVGKSLIFSNADAFKQACLDEVRDGARNFILDFSGTGILDSTGLSAIFSLHKQVKPRKGEVIFASVSPPPEGGGDIRFGLASGADRDTDDWDP